MVEKAAMVLDPNINVEVEAVNQSRAPAGFYQILIWAPLSVNRGNLLIPKDFLPACGWGMPAVIWPHKNDYSARSWSILCKSTPPESYRPPTSV
jgi:hypothetical protein